MKHLSYSEKYEYSRVAFLENVTIYLLYMYASGGKVCKI